VSSTSFPFVSEFVI